MKLAMMEKDVRGQPVQDPFFFQSIVRCHSVVGVPHETLLQEVNEELILTLPHDMSEGFGAWHSCAISM